MKKKKFFFTDLFLKNVDFIAFQLTQQLQEDLPKIAHFSDFKFLQYCVFCFLLHNKRISVQKESLIGSTA